MSYFTLLYILYLDSLKSFIVLFLEMRKTHALGLFHISLGCIGFLLTEYVVAHPYIFFFQINRVFGCHQCDRRVMNQEKLHTLYVWGKHKEWFCFIVLCCSTWIKFNGHRICMLNITSRSNAFVCDVCFEKFYECDMF